MQLLSEQPTSRRRILALATAIAVVAGVLSFAVPALVAPQPAAAADLSAFDPGLIITDDVFYNSTTMSSTSIQSFLHSEDPDCVSGGSYTCLQDYSMKTTTRAATAECKKYTGASSQSAATIIAKVATACDINPQVIIVTLQKEQGFITGGARTSAIYRKAMGYGCPDTASCDSKYYGFYNQVYSAASQFQAYRLNPSHWRYVAGKTIAIQYSPSTSCGTQSVYIRNQATAGLYDYTPYVPDSAALNSGSDSCSSYGNLNFFRYFTDYFGNPANLLKNASFQDKTDDWTSGTNGSIGLTALANAAAAQSGTRYGQLRPTAAGRRLEQTVSHKSTPGQIYEANVWVKSGTTGTPVTGALAITTSGGTQEVVSVPFTSSDTWTSITAELPVEKSGHTSLHFEVVVDKANAKLSVDSTALYVSATQEPRTALTVDQSDINKGTNGGWVPSSSSLATKEGYVVGPVNGKYYLKLDAKKVGAYLMQRVPRVTAPTTSYTVGMWLRSGDSTPVAAHFKLLGEGGTSESVTTNVTVGSTWTYYTATLELANPGHKSLRIYVYPDTLNSELLMDYVSLVPNLLVKDSSFESGTSAINTPPTGTTATRMTATGLGSAAPAPDGQGALEVTKSGSATSYIHLDRSRVMVPGQSYTVSAWVRSATPGTSYSGTLSVQGILAANPAADPVGVAFTAGDTWKLVTAKYTVPADADVDRLRTSVSLTTPSASVLVDGVSLH
jgi:hypothetical protein